MFALFKAVLCCGMFMGEGFHQLGSTDSPFQNSDVFVSYLWLTQDETENSPTDFSQKLDGLCLVVPKDDRQKQIYIYDLKMWTKAGASVSLGEARWFAAGR